MSELFDDEDKALDTEDESLEVETVVDIEGVVLEHPEDSISDARRRLENLLDEKRLRDELEDFLDY